MKEPDSAIEVPRSVAYLALILMAGASLVGWWSLSSSGKPEAIFEPPSKFVEPAPMCPWREPESDMRVFFPEAIRQQAEVKILSGKRLELQRQLGRVPTAEENALYLYRILGREEHRLGSVVVRRVKGESGAIEIVLAVDTNQTVRGVRLQRIREPESVAQALQQPAWLSSFAGQKAEPGSPTRAVLASKLPTEAQRSGEAIEEGVRSLLILLSAAEDGELRRTPHH